jgi:hypothetical protein
MNGTKFNSDSGFNNKFCMLKIDHVSANMDAAQMPPLLFPADTVSGCFASKTGIGFAWNL